MPLTAEEYSRLRGAGDELPWDDVDRAMVASGLVEMTWENDEVESYNNSEKGERAARIHEAFLGVNQ